MKIALLIYGSVRQWRSTLCHRLWKMDPHPSESIRHVDSSEHFTPWVTSGRTNKSPINTCQLGILPAGNNRNWHRNKTSVLLLKAERQSHTRQSVGPPLDFHHSCYRCLITIIPVSYSATMRMSFLDFLWNILYNSYSCVGVTTTRGSRRSWWNTSYIRADREDFKIERKAKSGTEGSIQWKDVFRPSAVCLTDTLIWNFTFPNSFQQNIKSIS